MSDSHHGTVKAYLTTRTDKRTGDTFPAIKFKGGGYFLIMDLTDTERAYSLVHRLHDLIEEHERQQG